MGMQHFGLHEQMAAHHNLDTAKAHFDRYSIHQWQGGGLEPAPAQPGSAHLLGGVAGSVDTAQLLQHI